ncbi:DeoR family transcriptional regulator [Pelagibacteraceae bacterium]|nr:DeoR family transcriptional regulator [Pelagibacteraceae bacterium]
MSNPVDIKIARINNQENIKGSLDKDKVFEVFQKNINEVLKGLYRLQQDWVNRSYLNFNDFDTYLILMYLMNKVYINYSDRFHYMSMEVFYSQEKVGIEKLNLIEISKDLNIPKETVRRKINYLQKHDIIIRTGKTIFLNSKGLEIQKPMATIENMASLLSKISIYLSAEDWFGKALGKEDIKKFITEHFTVSWEYWYRFQIPYLTRHRAFFGDLESWNVWGSIGLVQIRSFIEEITNDVSTKPKTYGDFFLMNLKHKAKRGINASSISDISSIPRATVIRKLKTLEKKKLINRNKKLEYSMGAKRDDLKMIEKNYLISQRAFSDYASTMFNLMKFSKFSI